MKFSKAELRATFEKMRPHRAIWPGTFDEAMRLPLVVSVLHTMTAHPGSLTWWLAQQEPPHLRPSPIPHFRKPASSLDWKQRASGEKDND